MDGVLMQGSKAIQGAPDFIKRLADGAHKFLVLTNNSKYTAEDIHYRLKVAGVLVDPANIYSSAMATAAFLHAQKPSGSAFVIGGSGLYQALHDVNYTLTDYSPDFVVLGETESFPYDAILRASKLIMNGTPFIATNPDPNGPTEGGIVPACGAVAAMIEKATGFAPYFVGKPNPLILRLALRHLNEHSENSVMVGDRMDTDIKIGIESGLETILVLSGVTNEAMINSFPFRPQRIYSSVADIDVEEVA